MLPLGSALKQQRFPRATVALVMANFAVFACQVLFAPYLSEQQKLFFTYGTGSLHPVALFASIFLHGSFFHVLFNNIYLWVFGPPVEDRVGPRLFVVYYLGAGVAANVLEVVVDAVHAPTAITFGLGASGAISGIMALYAYRCWHAKVKMFVPLLFLPVTLRIPAVPFMIFYFLQNVAAGVGSFALPTGIAYWAHVGGFLFGLAVGRIKRYGHEAAVEKYETAVADGLDPLAGWDGLKDDSALRKLVELEPDDPRRHLDLARYYAVKGEQQMARDSYRRAVLKYLPRHPYYGACTLLEMMDSGHGSMELPHHVAASEELAAAGFPDEAYRVLGPALGDGGTGALAGRAHLLRLKLCRELCREEELATGIEAFTARFPGSAQAASDIPKLERGAIFPRKAVPVPEAAMNALEKPDRFTGAESRLANCFSRPLAILTDARFFGLFIAFLPLALLFGWYFVLFLAYGIAALSRALGRIEWWNLLWKAGVNEERVRVEAEAATLYNRAKLAERGEEDGKAAELYEKLLAIDGRNVQARFHLARIYRVKLKDRNNALRQFRKLLELLPPDHPYRHEAEEAIRTRCARGETSGSEESSDSL